ncbi:MAG: hypothetical protein ACP5P4_13820 [Steroidobacteraceae bacterium]
MPLELFAPCEYGYQFNVILTNAARSARKLLALRDARGAQEAIFVELKPQTQMDYIPCTRRATNQTWLLSAVMGHNLKRELQMSADQPERSTTGPRAPWWSFVRLGTLRMRWIQRADRLTTPKGRLTLTSSANPDVQDELLRYLRAAA